MATEVVNVNEFQELARQALPKMYYDFYSGGAEDQHTLRENVEAFRRITIRPRILVDVSRIDTSTTILGYNTAAPIMIAPTSMHKLAHPEGEVATAKAAASCNTIMALSFSSTCTVEEVAASCNAVRFFQLYVCKRRDMSALLVQKAEQNGFKAIILTVDNPRLGRREADVKNKMVRPQLRNFEGLLSTEVVSDKGSNFAAYTAQNFDDSLCWKVIHAVGGKVPVLFDGGVRRGTDIFKALALGAQAVLVGRPVLYGLAAMGEHGVRRVIEMLKDELELTMALSGCPTLKDITRNHVRTQRDLMQCKL
ncbi:peroxisomal (S)-2-hydroxyacid oxidase GLO4-like isoform X2 [Cornus florida]|uniref:peroxisomal (S)-2-hydroxyacid oxidase GLO4-like isoform X2 n=1 Tax=Cornus florida TaxID=4283 RepID=UPI002898A305|nr:peroxisomal (S)-2-hydroxyacid oxidase GLO4-like isoform X2 [Cornus florida]